MPGLRVELSEPFLGFLLVGPSGENSTSPPISPESFEGIWVLVIVKVNQGTLMWRKGGGDDAIIASSSERQCQTVHIVDVVPDHPKTYSNEPDRKQPVRCVGI